MSCKKKGRPGRTLWLHLKYPESRYDVREEYLIYDINSFIADVGGFLGLLLGYSILGLLESLTEAIEQFVPRAIEKGKKVAA